MIPYDFITEWREHVPWIKDIQVEQDLILTRAVVEMFRRPGVADTMSFRGGTALYKLHLSPPSRYSEDIDLVQTQAGPIGDAAVKTYHLDELLGTKLRALYQRKKGRDLFDIWDASCRAHVDPKRIVECFQRYIEHQGLRISRAEFETNLLAKLADEDFDRDIVPLLASGVRWDIKAAAKYVLYELAPIMRGKPWKGAKTKPAPSK